MIRKSLPKAAGGLAALCLSFALLLGFYRHGRTYDSGILTIDSRAVRLVERGSYDGRIFRVASRNESVHFVGTEDGRIILMVCPREGGGAGSLYLLGKEGVRRLGRGPSGLKGVLDLRMKDRRTLLIKRSNSSKDVEITLDIGDSSGGIRLDQNQQTLRFIGPYTSVYGFRLIDAKTGRRLRNSSLRGTPAVVEDSAMAPLLAGLRANFVDCGEDKVLDF